MDLVLAFQAIVILAGTALVVRSVFIARRANRMPTASTAKAEEHFHSASVAFAGAALTLVGSLVGAVAVIARHL